MIAVFGQVTATLLDRYGGVLSEFSIKPTAMLPIIGDINGDATPDIILFTNTSAYVVLLEQHQGSRDVALLAIGIFVVLGGLLFRQICLPVEARHRGTDHAD